MYNRNQIIIFFAVITLIVSFPLSAIAQIDPGFNPSKLIEDSTFSDTQTFGGAAGIQKFLEVKNSVLANTSPDFLIKLKEPQNTLLKQGLEDPEPNLDHLRTAAQLIWDASAQSGLNPQVILVTLNKEQGLITSAQNFSSDQLQTALDHAMGFACPDSGGCGNLFPGFYYQLFGNYDSDGNRYLGASKSLMKSFSTTGGRGPQIDSTGAVDGSTGATRISKVGDNITLDNTTGDPYNAAATQTVTLQNSATAALYRYTPHVFNGNYNFWRYFESWFRYPNGTLIKLSADSSIYIIEDGVKQLVPSFVAAARNLVLGNAVTVSPNEFSSYPTDQVYGPIDNTIVQVPGQNKYYVFLNNVKHPASEFVIKQRGLSTTTAVSISANDSALFADGPVLTPKDGTVLKGQKDTGIYLVQNGVLELYSSYVYNQRKAGKSLVVIPDSEVVSYPKQGFVPPLDGTLVKSQDNAMVFLIDGGNKRPASAAVFKNRRFSYKNVISLSDDEVASLPVGAAVNPAEQTYFADTETGQLYIYKDGTKHSISSFVAKQRGITPDYSFSDRDVAEWPEGIAIPPRDGTLVKGSTDSTVYLVSKGQLDGLTGTAFKARRYSLKSIKVLPQSEVDVYAKGDVIQK